MQYLYLDESGDLGVDFVNKKPSKYLTLTILSVTGADNNRQLINTVKRTIRKKLKPRGDKYHLELKASRTDNNIIEYFLGRLSRLNIKDYSLSLNKRRLYPGLAREKERVYNYIARLAVDKVELESKAGCIEFIIDKSKGKKEVTEFDEYVKRQLQGRIDPDKTKLVIRHADSCVVHGLQAADSLCWAVFRKYERRDERWIKIISRILKYESLYLPEK